MLFNISGFLPTSQVVLRPLFIKFSTWYCPRSMSKHSFFHVVVSILYHCIHLLSVLFCYKSFSRKCMIRKPLLLFCLNFLRRYLTMEYDVLLCLTCLVSGKAPWLIRPPCLLAFKECSVLMWFSQYNLFKALVCQNQAITKTQQCHVNLYNSN